MITVMRVAKLDEGVFGVILHLGIPFAVTLEKSFDNNEPIIPAGTYDCVSRKYNKGGYMTFEIVGVDGHSLLLFHKANWETDLAGCVGIGESYAKLNGKLAIAQSGDGFGEFMRKVGHLPSFKTTFEDC